MQLKLFDVYFVQNNVSNNDSIVFAYKGEIPIGLQKLNKGGDKMLKKFILEALEKWEKTADKTSTNADDLAVAVLKTIVNFLM